MGLLSLEHRRCASRADYVLYGAVIAALAVDLGLHTPASEFWPQSTWVLGGTLAWTLVEYVVHRFVSHDLPPWRGWHAAHRGSTSALIGLPTWFSAVLFAGLVAVPAWWLLGAARAQAFTLGVLAGYLMYAVVHRVVHRTRPAAVVSPPPPRTRTTTPAYWLRERRRIHALHHGPSQGTAGHGSRSDDWGRLLGSPVTEGVRLVRR